MITLIWLQYAPTSPFLSDLLYTWSGRLAKPTGPSGTRGIWCRVGVTLASLATSLVMLLLLLVASLVLVTLSPLLRLAWLEGVSCSWLASSSSSSSMMLSPIRPGPDSWILSVSVSTCNRMDCSLLKLGRPRKDHNGRAGWLAQIIQATEGSSLHIALLSHSVLILKALVDTFNKVKVIVNSRVFSFYFEFFANLRLNLCSPR